MAERYLLDACAIIAYLSDEDGADKVEELLWQSNQETGKLFMHELNLLEVYYGVTETRVKNWRKKRLKR
jgi:uncharacterized protein